MMRPSSLGLLAVLLATCAGLLTAAPASALAQPADAGGSADAQKLLDLPIEQLMNLEVTSVGKKPERLGDTAAAVYVITQEDIRRSGLTSIPELLRMVPGLDVAQTDARHWAVSVRGFNSVYASKLLVLVDGRSVYTPVFSGVLWDQQDLPLEDIDRIEVIRGPGATIWGANAVNGVINIITKPAADTQGPSASFGVGTDTTAEGTLQQGGKLGPDASYRIYLRGLERRSFDTPDGGSAGDRWREGRLGARLDWSPSAADDLSLQGESFGERTDGILLPPSLVGPPVPTSVVQKDWGGHVLGAWNHRFSANSELTVQGYFDRMHWEDYTDAIGVDTYDLEVRHHLQPGARHDIVWGAGFRDVRYDARPNPYVTVVPYQGSEQIFNVFAQDEFALASSVHLIGGIKFEHNSFTGWESEPSLRVVWTPAANQTLWAAVSRAIRMPSIGDEAVVFNRIGFPATTVSPPILVRVLGDPGLQRSEELVAWEAGYRAAVGRSVELDLATFYNRYSSLASIGSGAPFFEPAPPPPHLVAPQVYGNQLKAQSYGLEAQVNWQATRRWRLSASYSLLQARVSAAAPGVDLASQGLVQGFGPHYQLQLRSYLDLPGRVELDSAIYRVGRIAGTGTPAYTRLDIRLGWRVNDRLSASLSGRNLLQARHAEFSALDLSAPVQVPRSVYATIAVRY
jgi:iron complex outermembrane receptor protein